MKIILACCPSWSIQYPPYNISLLKSILTKAGHTVKNFDFNIESYHFLKKEDIDFWIGQNYFYWEGDEFDNIIFPKIENLMNEWVDNILKYNPQFIGFTLYHTNWRCTQHIIKKIKKRNNEIKIMLGGPQCFEAKHDFSYTSISDYICNAEGEHEILNIINNTIPSAQRVDINISPIPDYSDYTISDYGNQGMSLEASRGCIAKCAFCMETHYWKYRYKRADVLINELKEYIKKYNITHYRFNDSLINGHIKEFYKFICLLHEENLGITWEAYARINGKMDLNFMKKIKLSGVDHLSYGIESGSQKVLDDMKKEINIDEIEQNLKDGYEAGVRSHVNWMVGFPSETNYDNLLSLIFLFNNRKYINDISPGMTCGIGSRSDLKLHGEKYKLLPEFYWDNFVTEEFKNTAIHRFIRLKCTHIWLQLIEINNGQMGSKSKYLQEQYNIEFLNKKNINIIDYNEAIDFSYLHKETFSSSLYSEYLSFFYVIYKAFGSFSMTLLFNKDTDTSEFGKAIVKEYNAECKFKMESNRYELQLTHNLDTVKPFNESISFKGEFN